MKHAIGILTVFPGITTMKFVIAATVLTLVELSIQTDYCNKALCGSKPHVACNGPTWLSPKCGVGSKEILMDAKLKALIVDEHNQFRSKIAMGKQEYAPGRFYPQAARMATMQWDDELAYVAGFNVRSCNFAQDECHNTDTFKAPDRILLRKFTPDNRILHHLSEQFFNLGMSKVPTQTHPLLPAIHRT